MLDANEMVDVAAEKARRRDETERRMAEALVMAKNALRLAGFFDGTGPVTQFDFDWCGDPKARVVRDKEAAFRFEDNAVKLAVGYLAGWGARTDA